MVNEKLMQQIDQDGLIVLGFVKRDDGSGDPRGVDFLHETGDYKICIDPWYQVDLYRKEDDPDPITIHCENVQDLKKLLHWVRTEKPTYKPLSELHLDREACERIWEFFVTADVELGEITNNPQDGWISFSEFKPAHYDEAEPMHKINLFDTGNFYWWHGESFTANLNPFSFVDFVRSLGYSPARAFGRL